MSRVLVTGANGFVGKDLCKLLLASGHTVVGTTRSQVQTGDDPSYELRTVGDMGDAVNWGEVLDGVECVVHLAARVHVMRDVEKDPLSAFRKVNVWGTEQLLRHEGMRSVKRVIYLSTVKVHGDQTDDQVFRSTDVLAPNDPYAISKYEAEQLVESLGAKYGFETVIIRPPLVYGPGVGGNFARLLSLVDNGVPLPLGAVRNARSLVAVANLSDLIRECIGNPKAPGERFLVSDNHDLSTPELLRIIANAMSRPARLIPVPEKALLLAARLLGRSAEASRLIGSLQIDINETLRVLDWLPPASPTDGIAAAVDWYSEQQGRE
ncbi:MAG: NAD-dependent epimerase/dehydratase family protein [Gammaproteobacteria bacterium]|nr:NAD-dependent epimerase/dehydratase family protein [Gammaproteobacteria bacterium]